MIARYDLAMDVDIDLDFSDEPAKDGQVNIKLPKADEIRFKMQKAKFDKKLNAWARDLILKLLDKLEEHERAS